MAIFASMTQKLFLPRVRDDRSQFAHWRPVVRTVACSKRIPTRQFTDVIMLLISVLTAAKLIFLKRKIKLYCILMMMMMDFELVNRSVSP